MDDADYSFGDTQDRFRVMAEHLPQLVWTALPSGNHDWFNQRCRDYTGLDLAELKSAWKDYIHPDDLERARAVWSHAISTGDAYEIEYRIKGSDGIFRRFLVRALPMQGSHGQIIRWFGTCTDLSTLSHMQIGKSYQSVQAQKFEEMGQLTGSVIHDFNNLLTAVLGNLELITMRSSDETLLRYAGNALEAARRGVKLTSQLLAFTRSQSLEISTLDINSLIRGMDDLLRRSLGSDVTLVMDLEANLPPALGNAAQLELAILNLAVNGRDAMIDKGQLSISTRTEAADLFSKGRQSRVIVTVRDNGSGIEPEILEHVFEPFFTTKKPGKGTGLGLAQVRSIARQCGGGVTIDSTVGTGTSVNIFLPISAGYQAEKESDPMLALPVKGSSEIILVIDDDADVRRYLVESLTSIAYIVFEAPDGQSGLKMLDEMCPDLLIVDYVMPGLSGLQVIQKITETCPEMPVILTSGYSEAGTLSDGAGSIRFLPKPFTATELSHAVRNALNAHNSARKDTPISHVA